MIFFREFCLLTSVIFLFFGAFVLYKGQTRLLNRMWFAVSVSISLWSLGLGFMSYAPSFKTAFFWLKWFHYGFGAIFIPVLYLHFTLVLVGKENYCKKLLFSCYFLTAIFFISNVFDLFATVKVKPPFEFYTHPKLFYWPYTCFFFVIITYSLLSTLFSLKEATGLRRQQIKYHAFATICGFSGGITTFFYVFDVNILPYGYYTVFIYNLIMTYAIVRFNLMDIRLAITKAGIFIVSYIPVLLLPYIVGHFTKSWLLSTSLAIILATIGPTVYRSIQRKAEANLLIDQRRYQSTLIQAARGMVKIRDLSRLVTLITHICAKAVRTRTAYMFLHNADNNIYQLVSSRYSLTDKEELFVNENHPIVEYMYRARGPLVIDEILIGRDLDLSDEDKYTILNFSKEHDIHLLVPSFTEGNFLGFLALGLKSNKRAYSAEDISVFSALAHQAALAIENCQFLEESHKAQEKIFNAEKLATLGAMASGLSHQLNNRLQEFSVIAGDLIDLASCLDDKNAIPDSLTADFEYFKKGLGGIEKNVQHSSRIIRGVLDYARTEKDQDFKLVDINKVIDPAIGLLKVKHPTKDFVPSVKVEDDVPNIYGSLALLSEAFFNLIDNAYESIEQREELYRRKKLKNPEKSIEVEVVAKDDHLYITVTDNGLGIKKEDEAKMYAPFFTTKSSVKSGTGLGMYVIKRIIEDDHKGKLWFDSEYLHGCTFFVSLPLSK